MARNRVVVVEDDAALRRFVALALADLDVDLVQCADTAQAMAALQAAPARLVITDLMMPGEPGYVLIERLRADPALRAGARVAVFSAGLTPPVQQRLAALGVWRFLVKPVSVEALERCVLDALADGTDEPPSPKLPMPSSGDRCGPARAVTAHFGGDQALYDAFLATCRLQFQADLEQGEAFLRTRDADGLRRLAHSLKSVLLTLGHEAASAHAHSLEDACAGAAPWPDIRHFWLVVHDELAALAAR
ncbi:MAG: response regulator [Caldimonas sp.]|uniref:Hpt domain-containing response regulator n=1 Tax=Caldimonas sp. TaxID=2838790 RepID=UPI00391CDCA9